METDTSEASDQRCRVCLEITKYPFNLLDISKSKNKNISYLEILSAVCELKSENVPLNICRSCAQNAVISYDFKVLCEHSDEVLNKEIQLKVIKDDDDENFSESDDDGYEKIIIKQEIMDTDDQLDPRTITLGTIKCNKNKSIVEINESNSQESPQVPTNTNINIKPAKVKLIYYKGIMDQQTNTVQSKAKNKDSTSLTEETKEDLPTVKVEKGSNFFCPTCNRTFSRKWLLNRHMLHCEEDLKNTEIMCSKCRKTFPKHSSLKRHMFYCSKTTNIILESDKKESNLDLNMCPDICDLCDYKPNSVDDFNEHYKIHPSNDGIDCIFCDLLVRTENYKKHLVDIHHDKKMSCIYCDEEILHESKEKCLRKLFPEVCQYCDYKPSSHFNYHIHKQTEHLQNTIQICIYCEFNYKRYTDYEEHLNLKHPDKKQDCNYCALTFYTHMAYSSHILQKHPNEKFNCHLCDFTCKISSNLNSHYQENHSDYFQTRQCKFCDFSTHCPISLEKHLHSIHENKKTLQCDKCEQTFFYIHMMQNHMKTQHHNQQSSTICDICGKYLKTGYNLKQHMYTHENEFKFECKICSKSFRCPSTLYKHTLFHSGERKQCSWCGLMFKQLSHLKAHERSVHEKRKPFSCKLCELRFTSKYGLKRHEQIHTGNKEYECEECGKLFMSRSNLVQHSVVHTGERKHICEVCGKTFTQAQVLRSHLKIHDTG